MDKISINKFVLAAIIAPCLFNSNVAIAQDNPPVFNEGKGSEETTITTDTDKKLGTLTLTYRSILVGIDPAPLAYIQGKWKWTGGSTKWDAKKQYRICMEFGTDD